MSDSAEVALIAALPREVHALVSGLRPDQALRGQGIHLYRRGTAVIVAAGMGAARVSLAFEAALACGALKLVVSCGLAGSCSPGLGAGSVAEAGGVVDARTGERFSAAPARSTALLATAASMAGVQEKARLAGSYGAAMVDMEAATVARLARAHGIAFRAVKGISDAHDFELASLARFEGKHGHFRTTAFALHTALRPRQWAPAAKLGRESSRALTALDLRLREILDEFSVLSASKLE